MSAPRYRVGVLGATGLVGQHLVARLAAHPWFELTAVAASDRSAGKRYADAVRWHLTAPIPDAVRDLMVQPAEPELPCDFAFSALDAAVAGPVEEAFARAGYPVISNSSAHRMANDVPLLAPEVNPDHIALIDVQRRKRNYESGFIVTNPNCSAAGLVLALKPLEDAFGVEAVNVVTMQALSGAGYPGVAALDALDNIIPFIAGEEEKLESEPLKILGALRNGRIEPAALTLSAQCHRVPVRDGHLEAVSVKLRRRASPADARDALRNFTALPQRLELPSAPARPIEVCDAPDRPQPRLDRDAGDGMAVVVGRIRECPVFDIRFTLLSHNLVRGAAGAALLNAELLAHSGYLTRHMESLSTHSLLAAPVLEFTAT